MKQFAYLFLFLIVLFSCSKHNEQIPIVPDPELNVVYGGSAMNQAYAAIQGSEGTYVLAGSTKGGSGNQGKSDAWVLKLDKQGQIIWQKIFGGSDDDGAYSVVFTREGGYIIAGFTYSNDGDVTGNHGNSDAWVVKLDKNGNKEWQKTFGGSSVDDAFSIVETSDGGYIMAGQTESTGGDVSNNHGNSDAWVVKLDKNGNKEWQKTFGGTGSEGARSIIKTSEGGYIMAGWTNSNDGDVTGYHVGWGMYIGNIDGWVVKLNEDGNRLWSKAFGGSRQESFTSITQGPDNTYTVAGSTSSNGDGDVGFMHGYVDVWVVNIDKEGKIAWQKPLGGSAGEMANSIASTGDGGYIFSGNTSSNDGDVSGNHGKEDAWVVKLDKAGNKQWQKTLGGSGNDVGRVIFQRINGGYLMAANTGSNDGDVAGQPRVGGAWIVTIKDQ